MRKERIFVLVVVGILWLSLMPAYNVEGGWTSPGQDQTYTLDWLAENTISVRAGEEDIYYLEDDVTITWSNTLNFGAGEYLYIDQGKKITINGDWNVNGVLNNKMHIHMTNDLESSSTNIEWSENSEPPNTFSITQLEFTKGIMVFNNDEDDLMTIGPAFYTNDVPEGVKRPDSDKVVFDFDLEEACIFATSTVYWWEELEGPALLRPDDDDGDGMKNGWEVVNGFDPDDPDDALEDADGDGLSNLGEFNHKTNPWVMDTDGDTLDDGEEVHGCGPPDDYTSDPLKQHSDTDAVRDDTEIWDGNGYVTDPCDPDTDGDTLNDGYEYDNDLNPRDVDTDDDNFNDNRDPEPTLENRKFAFIFEINDYIQVAHNVYDWESDDVANQLADADWDVYLYTDTAYQNLDDGVTETEYLNGCTWDKFQGDGNGWDDFKDQGGVGTTVGNPPQGYGDDIVFVYIAGWGFYDNQVFELWFYGSGAFDVEKTEDDLEGVLDDFSGDDDIRWVLWIQSHHSSNWDGDIGSNDGLNFDDRIVVTIDGGHVPAGAVTEKATVFNEIWTDHETYMNKGLETLYEDLSDPETHELTDQWTEAAPTTNWFYFE